MRSEFQNLDIQCWEHIGSRLGKHRPYICLQGNAEACDIVLKALDELADEGAPAQRTLTLKPCKRRKTCSTIRLLLVSASEELNEMSLRKVQATAIFEFTSTGLPVFRKAASARRNGDADFCVEPCRTTGGVSDNESGEVWFWTRLTEP